MKRTFLKFLGAAALAAGVSACGGGDDDENRTIVDVARNNNFTALLAAADKAGLVGALNDRDARLTVFAPTDAAFGELATQLGFANAAAMVTALPASALASILSYHVLPSQELAAALIAGGPTQATIYSFESAPATLTLDTTGGVVITDAALAQATVTMPDVGASNGVIHVIDKVLVPPGVLNVVQMAQVNPAVFSSLVGAVVATGLDGALSDANATLTVFAPTNDAFAGAPGGLTTQQLTTVLTYHVLSTQVLSTAIPFGQPVTTLANQDITIEVGTAPVIATITDTTATPAEIQAVDVRASNGVIHVIDKVLIPSLGT